MALFGHDDNVRRLSSNISAAGFEEQLEQDGHTSCCCGCSSGSGKSGKTRGEKKCTAAKIKSCLKLFFAQLFSHVGLCALVVGYSIMGAFIFVYLEKENELQTRVKVGDTRKQTLEQLYGITAPLRLEVILQEDKIERLKEQIDNLSKLLKTCKRQQKRERQFLQSVIISHKRDNVALSAQTCFNECSEKKVLKATCQQLCQTSKDPCSYVHKVIKNARASAKTTESPLHANASSDTTLRIRRWIDGQVLQSNVSSGPVTVVLTDKNKPKKTYAKLKPFLIPPPIPTPVHPLEESFHIIPYSAQRLVFRQEDEVPSGISQCRKITCITDERKRATLCFQIASKHSELLSAIESMDERLNVLHPVNWTKEAGVVLRRFEQEVIRKAKTEGYDGQNNTSSVQWNFSGALLYSVTVITTIGYGNIAPKTNWGRVVTMFYAIFGMPLFLMWASQMGTFLAQTFQFFYANVCCALCRAGRRRRAAAQAAAKLRKQETLVNASNERDPSDGSVVRVGMTELENGRYMDDQRAIKENLINLATPAHVVTSYNGNGVESQATNDKPVRIEILEPDVKEILSTCALYNLDQEEGDPDSGEVLEEIRHAEALMSIRSNANTLAAQKKTNGTELNSTLQQHSPLKIRLNPDPDRESSFYENSEPSSPSTLTRANDALHVPPGASPLASRRARLAHQTVVSVGSGNGTPVTTLLRSGKSVKSREPSPASSYQAGNQISGLRCESVAGMGSVDSVLKNAASRPVPEVIINQDRVPVLPVLAFVFGYIMLGATIFSAWENWSFLEGAYFSFITLTTIGFGDFVPGDAVLNDESEQGQAKLILACIYLLMGLAIVAMSINLVQEEIVEKIRDFARDIGLVDDEDDDSVQNGIKVNAVHAQI